MSFTIGHTLKVPLTDRADPKASPYIGHLIRRPYSTTDWERVPIRIQLIINKANYTRLRLKAPKKVSMEQ